MSASKTLIVDLETTGLDPWKDDILMAGLYDGERYVCTRNKDEFDHALSKYEGWTLGGHNFAFDKRFLVVKGWL